MLLKHLATLQLLEASFLSFDTPTSCWFPQTLPDSPSINRKSPLIRFQTTEGESSLCLPFPWCCTPWQFPEKRSRWSLRNRRPGQSKALQEEGRKSDSVLKPCFIINSGNICQIIQKSYNNESWVPASIIHYSRESICIQGNQHIAADKLDLFLLGAV